MNKIIKELIAITLCFLIPFEALSINRAKEKTADNLNNVSANQSESTPKKNQIKNPINFKIPACLLTAGASFATLYKLLGPIGGKNSLSQKEKRFTNAGISNKKNEICFCNALLQILYSNISFRKFIDEINLEDLGKYDFSYELETSFSTYIAVYLDYKNNGKILTDDITVYAYNKDTSKKQDLFKRKVKLFRELFKLMDKEDVVPQSWIQNFVYVTLTGYSGGGGATLHCYFKLLKDVVCLYCQHYDISSPKLIKGIFPATFDCKSQKIPAQLFVSKTNVRGYKNLTGVLVPCTDQERQIEPLYGQFTIFTSEGRLTFPVNASNSPHSAGYEFKHTDGKTYVLTAVVTCTPRHVYAFKREADGNWYKYDDSWVSKTSWSNVKKAIENLNTNEFSGGLVYTFTEKEVFAQSMREAAQK